MVTSVGGAFGVAADLAHPDCAGQANSAQRHDDCWALLSCSVSTEVKVGGLPSSVRRREGWPRQPEQFQGQQ